MCIKEQLIEQIDSFSQSDSGAKNKSATGKK